MKILVIGDSVGLPLFHRTRDEVEIGYEEVYPERLRQLLRQQYPGEDILLLNQCRHAQTSHVLVSGAANEVLFLRPEVLVLQLGMTDLWPAAGRNIPAPAPKMEGRDPWISAEEFRGNFTRFLDFCAGFDGLSVLLVNIPCVSQDQYRRYPEALERTERYNRILFELADRPGVSLIDAFDLFKKFGESAYSSDRIHPASQAARALAGEILQSIVQTRP
jgi:lysophospholipase L1-like esterase